MGVMGIFKQTRGFTIVELLIVIVVIAILAAITIVAYNGIQTQTKNTKTINAAAAWIKALKLYEADNGAFPSANSCLGTTTTYDGNGRCWDSGTWVINSAFLTAMSKYMSSSPEPDTTYIDPVNNPDRRGAFYHTSGSIRYIWVMLVGINSCPDIAGLPLSTQGSGTDGIYCRYVLSS